MGRGITQIVPIIFLLSDVLSNSVSYNECSMLSYFIRIIFLPGLNKLKALCSLLCDDDESTGVNGIIRYVPLEAWQCH